jgi:mannose-1-phosphate guanylyltransferase
MAVHVVLLAGGRGTRFWPLSRRRRPKQLLSLVSRESLLRETWRRVAALARPERRWLITGSDLRRACLRELPELPPGRCIGEPVGRNTAAALALATALIERCDPRAVMAVFPCDHHIGDLPAFRRLARQALGIAREERALVILGIRPVRADTGYGYIELAGGGARKGARAVKRFVEKPSPARARAFLAGGRHLWNSGMFFLNVAALVEAWREHSPEIWEPLAALADDFGSRRFAAKLKATYESLPAQPFDVAIMEKVQGVKVLPAEMKWSDIGNWLTIADMLPERGGNHSAGPLVCDDAKGNIVMDPEGLTALVGVDDLIVVKTRDALLVCHRDKVGDLRELVERLESEGLSLYV